MGGAWASDLSTWSLVAPKRRNPPGEGTPGPVSAARRASSDLSAGATLSGQHGLALTCRPQWALLWAHHGHSLLHASRRWESVQDFRKHTQKGSLPPFVFQTVQVRCQSPCHSSPLSDTCPKPAASAGAGRAGPGSPPHTALCLPCTSRPFFLGASSCSKLSRQHRGDSARQSPFLFIRGHCKDPSPWVSLDNQVSPKLRSLSLFMKVCLCPIVLFKPTIGG